ncbi:calcium-binding protein [Rhizobium alvei]|uniref:Uncharacterized protein n=1 Tax=Rhizobium alvei TaxID=1132659 RepID=A0ABT8YS03_9HYPH|nr:hypothetical protein [Rhizobium alvei]MDO6966523.1 hypothetical protein [Rhizobium alvei]
MARHFTNEDRTSTWNITKGGDLWVVGQQAHFQIDGTGIDTNGFSNTRIKIFGDLTTSSNDECGINATGGKTSIFVGATSNITVSGAAAVAIGGDGKNVSIVNHGHLESGEWGVNLNNGGNVFNDGTIRGETGIEIACKDQNAAGRVTNERLIDADSVGVDMTGLSSSATDTAAGAKTTATMINGEDGIIRSDNIGIIFRGTDGNRLVNDGIIRAPRAMIDEDVSTTVINRGKIFGNVLLEGGNDTFITRGGSIDGKVYGGAGSDTYIITGISPLQGFQIVEGIFKGVDTVKSSVSYTLGDYVENLVLLGNAQEATGNALDNRLVGSNKENTLSGYQGNDILDGRKGDDILHGHLGDDIFVFSRDYDRDTILGFEDGADKLKVEGMDSIYDYSAFSTKIHQVGVNVEIDLGNGDVLILEGMSKANISVSDFEY